MGYLIAQVMRFFRLSVDEMLKLPKRHFMWMVHQMSRVRALEDLRQLQLLSAVTHQESLEAATNQLLEDAGDVFHWEKAPPPKFTFNENDEGLDPDFDRAALRALKHKHGV